MTFHSLLFPSTEASSTRETLEAPEFFADLNLDQTVDAITAGREEYNLKPLFYTSLHDIDAIQRRHEIMQDLEDSTLCGSMRLFTQKMRTMRAYLAEADKLCYQYQRDRWFLDAVVIYCEAVTGLAHDLTFADLKARGFLAFREYAVDYVRSAGFAALLAETNRLQTELSSVRYCLLINGDCIQVGKYDAERDYCAAVEATFAKFRQGAVQDHRAKLPEWPEMNQVEARVLELVVRLYPEVFAGLHEYCARSSDYRDQTIGVFERDVEFCLAYLEYISGLRRAGLPFCYPRIVEADKSIYSYDGFDLALANKLVAENGAVVSNDFLLRGPERILVVTGPNQGGKTTFARAFGQLHYLAAIGCPVPGREAQLFLFDRLFTHFEKEESIDTLSGKLQDELVRIHAILSAATPRSIIIMNEIFTSTTLEDAIFLSKKIMERIIELDLLCVCVTFLDELASLGEQTVSLVSTVVPDNPALRTYKIVRKPADGLAYALSLAEKHRLTYACLKDRLKL